MSDKPRHVHDCAECRFLGCVGADDVYMHPDANMPGWATLIARHSDEPSDYDAVSHPTGAWRAFGSMLPAAELAASLNLITIAAKEYRLCKSPSR